MKTLILAVDDIRSIVRQTGRDILMDELIVRLTKAFEAYDPQWVKIPMRDGFYYSLPVTGLLEWMPIQMTGHQSAIKMVGYHPRNPGSQQLPTILSTISAYDCHNGHMVGLADATFLTALRTGAASAIASRAMASSDSRTLGLIGAGAQAITQAHALARVLPIDRVLVYDSDFTVAQSFSERFAFTGLPVHQSSAEELLQQSDIICTATSVDIGKGPVFEMGEIKPWLHINAVGSDFPGKTEVPAELLRKSLVVPDFREQAMKEGECQILSAHEIGPELVELIQHPERYPAIQAGLTVFDSTGWALEDYIALQMLLDFAAELNVGTAIDLEAISADPHDPWSFVGESETKPLDKGKKVR